MQYQNVKRANCLLQAQFQKETTMKALRLRLIATCFLGSLITVASGSVPKDASQPKKAEPEENGPAYDASVPQPAITGIRYGKHTRHVLDFWKAPSEQPTPLVFVIHGGGWKGGSKERLHRFVDTAALLEEGISVVAINYRLMAHAKGFQPPVKAPLHDAARALQFVRSKADEWNIDKTRIGAAGGSAGTCSSLWLAFHDDLADPKSEDPLARESTRLSCCAVKGPQTTLDPKQMKQWTPNSRYGGHAFGKKDFTQFLAERESVLPWIAEYSPYALVSAGDPPTCLFYNSAPAIGRNQKDPTHTANFGVKLEQRCEELGVECEVVYPGAADVRHKTPTDYLIATLKAPTEKELVAIRDGFTARKNAMLTSLAGKPFVRAAKHPPLTPGRARYVRHYSYSIIDFAIKAFLLNEQLDGANQALQEYGRFYLDNPAERNDRDNFYWPADVVCRIVEFFGSRGSRAPGRLTQQTEDILLEMAWVYSKETSKIADAETVVSKTWHVHESENHHLQRFSTVWHFSKLLSSDDRYEGRPYDDGKTALEHYQAWTEYALEFLRERARKGLFVEVASKGYGLQSIKCIYGFYDFAEDPSLKRTAGKFLDLFWATWAEEQINGVRGGGKTRVYQGLNSQAQWIDSMSRLAWYYLGQGDGSPPRGNEFSIMTSDYRLPLVVMDIALDTRGRGNYEIIQRRMGLAQDGYYTPPDYRLRTDFGGILRYSYCTPDFILGTLMCEARPLEDWTMISSQNRWHGVIFRGHPNARLYVQCRADKVEKTYNQQWSVQKKGTLITQKLAGDKYSDAPDELRVWFANSGLNNRQERGRCVFVEASDAYAAVCPIAGGYHWVKASGRADGDWLCCENSRTPVIIEIASKSQFADYRSFQQEILASELRFENQKLAYTGRGGDRFTFYADYSQVPEINGEAVDYAPAYVFKSPFIQSVWNSGMVTICKNQRKRTLDFNNP